MNKHLVHDDMVVNILRYRQAATAQQVEAGTAWYDVAGGIVQLIADQTHMDSVRVGFALSALSPRNPWRWNVADVYAYASARAEGRTMPTATTFKRNQLAAWRALDRNIPLVDVWFTAAPKVNAFVSAIMGDHGSVVVDTWAVKVATGGALKRVANTAQYQAVARAYSEAAGTIGENAAVTQAITWLVAQTEGLASNRRGRHDLSFKVGTPDFIRKALSEGVTA